MTDTHPCILTSLPDVVRAASEAIQFVSAGKHDPFVGHELIKNFYHWDRVTARTEKVYEAVMKSPQMDLMERISRSVFGLLSLSPSTFVTEPCLNVRTIGLGRFAGPIWTIILIVDCIFFMFLEWWLPRDELDYVQSTWDDERFRKVSTLPQSLALI